MAVPEIVWAAANDCGAFARAAFGNHIVAGVFDLDDPGLAPILGLPPTAADLMDEARPLAGPRASFLRRRSLTRALAGLALDHAPHDVVIAHDPRGAPIVQAPRSVLRVSVAARGPLAAIALGTTPVGIDFEPVGTPAAPIGELLHPGERARVEADWAAGRDDSFRDIWVAKEAWLKALGTGLVRDPASFEIRLDPGGGFVVDDGIAARRPRRGEWRSLPIGGAVLRCAVAAIAA